MAHGDYDCCAVCNSKMSYGGDSTKEEMCSTCLHDLRDEGLSILDPDEFIEWVGKTDRQELLPILHRLGFGFCYYENAVDEAVAKKLRLKKFYGQPLPEALSNRQEPRSAEAPDATPNQGVDHHE